MKCYIHKNKDAVGTCSSCNKGICDYCSVDVKRKLFCRSCAADDSGETKTAPPSTPAQPSEKAPAASPPAPAQNTGEGRKSPGLAAFLSFVFLGLGQVYNGQIMKFIALWFICISIMLVSSVLMLVVIGFFSMFLVFPVWLYSVYDAYATANDINRRLGA